MLNKIIKFKFNKIFLLFIFCYSILMVGSTYAFLEFGETNSTVSGIGGCSGVNYTGEEITGEDLVSTTTYTEGASSIVTLSKDEDCAIYTTAYIKLNTNDSTTAPITSNRALKYKVEKISGDGEILSGGEGFVNQIGELTLATVTLTENVTTYKVYLWLDVSLSIGYYNDKTYSGYIFAEAEQTSTIGATQLNAYATDIMVPVAKSDADVDFMQSSDESNTNGVYIRSGTENDANPIYYYRGNVNNNLIFADTCWKVVRTTETGGLKLIYNGIPSNGQCNNTGTASQIGTKQFNTSYNSLAYVGYMYSAVYTRSEKTMTDEAYYYGNSVSYSNDTYTLNNTITSGAWTDTYLTGLNNNHYTCFSTGTTCSSVNYVYYTDASKAYYITLSNGKTVEDAIIEMLGSDEGNADSYNTTSSTIKGNSTTAGTIDYWYYNNIEQKGYKDYLEDTVWCNDRTIYDKAGWEPNGGKTTTYLRFGGNGRLNYTKQPSLTCSREVDSFTVDEANGNGKLDYPVGLLTSDEIMLAGGRAVDNNSYYLYTGKHYWAGSPSHFSPDAYEYSVYSTGHLNIYYVSATHGVRPSVSLKPGFLLTGNGDGSGNNPYVVD